MTCYNGMAARNYAHNEGLLQDCDDARDDFSKSYLKHQLAAVKKDPKHEPKFGIGTIWEQFSERMCERCEPLNTPLSRLLAEYAALTKDDIDNLRTVSVTQADAAMLIRDEIHDMLLERASDEFDEADRTGNWEAIK